jgi:hypothetical protein
MALLHNWIAILPERGAVRLKWRRSDLGIIALLSASPNRRENNQR